MTNYHNYLTWQDECEFKILIRQNRAKRFRQKLRRASPERKKVSNRLAHARIEIDTKTVWTLAKQDCVTSSLGPR